MEREGERGGLREGEKDGERKREKLCVSSVGILSCVWYIRGVIVWWCGLCSVDYQQWLFIISLGISLFSLTFNGKLFLFFQKSFIYLYIMTLQWMDGFYDDYNVLVLVCAFSKISWKMMLVCVQCSLFWFCNVWIMLPNVFGMCTLDLIWQKHMSVLLLVQLASMHKRMQVADFEELFLWLAFL